jgi:hypothetical protein
MRVALPSLSNARAALLGLALTSTIGLLAAVGCGSSNSVSSGLPGGSATLDQVVHGRALVTSLGCSDCHNRGVDDPNSAQWLAGYVGAAGGAGQGTYNIGPFQTYAANLTPDTTTGLGALTDLQIYNALKFGLDPGETASAVITSTTPGTGNFPAAPHYLAPPMPWPAFRHLSDTDLWSIVAYLKHGIKPVSNVVPPSQGPGDHWAGSYSAAAIGPTDFSSYPSANEQYTP